MNLVAAAVGAVERMPLPDSVTRASNALLVKRASRRLQQVDPSAERAFAAQMAKFPIAVHADEANAQHYELPPAFFALILGPRRKYSCCLYDGATTLAA
jgi:cyclopropane-fatty-acyl-phospholipid synthase